MVEKLKDCPFCGGQAEIIKTEFEGERVYSVSCEDCNATTGASSDKGFVIEVWNCREENLLPCPNCGGQGLVSEVEIEGEKYLSVICEKCGISTFASQDELEVKAAWNTRTEKKQE